MKAEGIGLKDARLALRDSGVRRPSSWCLCQEQMLQALARSDLLVLYACQCTVHSCTVQYNVARRTGRILQPSPIRNRTESRIRNRTESIRNRTESIRNRTPATATVQLTVQLGAAGSTSIYSCTAYMYVCIHGRSTFQHVLVLPPRIYLLLLLLLDLATTTTSTTTSYNNNYYC